MRLGNEHVMGVYLIWKFAKNKEAAQKYVVDQQLNYQDHFVRSKYYNFLRKPGDQGQIQDHPLARGPGRAQAEGQVHDPDDHRREVHEQSGHPATRRR